MKNLKEFKALIKKYESITLQDLEKSKKGIERDFDLDGELGQISDTIAKITKFGSRNCTLCKAIGMDSIGTVAVCQACTWVKSTDNICYSGVNSDTYQHILHATSLHELKEAIEKRAKYMKKVLK